MSPCLSESEIEQIVNDGTLAVARADADAHLSICSICRDAVRSRREDVQLFQEIQRAFDADVPRDSAFSSLHVRTDPASTPGAIETIEGYEILGELHRGGQGVVYKAIQKATKRAVALKLMLQGPYASPRQRSRFEREVDLVASLQHPNIITVYDSGISHGRLFYAMEYVDGQPLDRFLAALDGGEPRPASAPPAMAVPDTLRLFQRICSAISYAHQHGVIHRDLKPANILVDAGKEPHVLDFGLAKLVAEDSLQGKLTATGEFLGTLAYASPEQARGDPRQIDVRSDVYSLGVILFEMLTGSYPYSVAGPLSDVLHQITDSEPRRPSTIRSEIDTEVETIVLKALAKEPDRRYQSAGHLAQDVLHYLQGEPIDAKRDSTWYLLRKSLRRHRAAVVTAAAFVLTITVALVISIHWWRRAVVERDIARKAQRQEEEARIAEQQARLSEKQQREAAESQAYVANVAAAEKALRATDIVEARLRLERAPERLRNWEWYQLHRRLDTAQRTLTGHSSYVYAVDFSPGGEWLASADWSGRVCIWDSRGGKLLREIQTSAPVTALQISPDGRTLATAGKHKAISFWNASDGRLESELVGPSPQVGGIAFSADGRRLASTHVIASNSADSDGSVLVWDLASHEVLVNVPAHRAVGRVAFSSDGGTIAATGNRQVRLWNASTGELVRTFACQETTAHAIAFSPDGSRLAISDSDWLVRIWDTNSAAELSCLAGHTGPVQSIAFSREPGDSGRIATGSRDKTVRLWSAGGEPLAVFSGHSWTVTSVSFSPDGGQVASGSWDTTVKMWDTSRLDEVATLRGHQQNTSGVAVSADGMFIASSSWDKSVRLWDATSFAPQIELEGHSAPVQCVAISPDGSRVASGSWDQTVRVWNPGEPSDVRILRGHTDRVQGLAFSPDGRWLVSGSRDNTIRFWNAATGEPAEILTGHTDHIHCVAFSPNGRLLASSGHESIKLWDVDTRSEKASFARTIVQEDYSLAFHPTGRLLAAGSDFRMLFVWDIERGEPIARLPNHSDEINSVAFTPDGSRLVSASVDGTVRVWDVASWAEITKLSGYSGRVTSLTFTPDGSRLVGGLNDGTIKIWCGAARVAGSSEK